MAKQERCVWVVGHKNPDTDSICAAISYAYLKNQTEDGHFIAKRAGSINNETRYVLERFGAKEPGLITDAEAHKEILSWQKNASRKL